MASPFIKTSFASGEIAPSLWGHVDIAKYSSAASTLRNMYVGFRGGAYSRAGTAFVNRSKQRADLGQAAPWLFPFRFSIGQQFPLEFGDNYIRFIANGGYVTEPGKTITGVSFASPCVLTIVGNGFSNGDWIYLSGVGGVSQLNGNTYIVAAAAANTVALNDLDGNPVDSTHFDGYTGGGTAARIYTVQSPYAATDLELLKFAQSADVMSLTHPNYPPYDLARLGPTNWTLTQTAFGASIAAPGAITASATTHPSGASTPPTLPCAYAYVATAVDPVTGQESVASPIVNVTDSVDMAATAGSIVDSWNPVAGAGYYNIYRAPPSYNTKPGDSANALPVPFGALFGYVGSSFGNQFVDANIIADLTRTPPLHRNPFVPGQILGITVSASSADWTTATVSITTATGTGFAGQVVIVSATVVAVIVVNPGQGYLAGDTPSIVGDGTSVTASAKIGPQTGTYPGLVSYFQERRVYAQTLNNPDTYWMSQPGAFTNFDSSIPVNDADAITGTPFSEQVDGLQWMITMPLGLVTFTGSGVIQVGAPGSFGSSPAAITPSNQLAAPQGSIGSSATLQPIKINWDLIYAEPDNSSVLDLTYQLYFNIYTAADISWPSSHLLIGHPIRDWAWCRRPYRILWMCREDGMLLSLTYVKEQEVAGWARHDTQGQVRSVCAVSELPVDALYMVVQRGVAGGGTRYFVERMDNRIWSGVEDSWCVDGGLANVLPIPNALLLASSSSGAVVFTANANVFSPGDATKVLRMGGGIATLTVYISPTQFIGTWLYDCQQIVPNDPLDTPFAAGSGTWSLAPLVTTVTGLQHLAGKIVVGVADGAPTGPLLVSATGSVVLPFPASRYVLGLGFAAQLQSVYLDTGQPTIQGRRKDIPAVTARIEASSAVQAGANQADASAQNPSPLFRNWTLPAAVNASEAPAPYVNPGGVLVQPLFTGDVRILTAADWRTPGQVAVQQLNPLPLNVLDLVPEVLAGDLPENEYSPRERRAA